MKRFVTTLRALSSDYYGVTAIEYALIAGVMAAAMAATVPAIGLYLAGVFGQFNGAF